MKEKQVADTENIAPPSEKIENQYERPKPHWFYAEAPDIWRPFSVLDSGRLENAYEDGKEATVATDGGRYDADLLERCKRPVYWDGSPEPIRRGTWFFRFDHCFAPYPEDVAERLEELYRTSLESGHWHCKLELSKQESVVLHSPEHYVHFCMSPLSDEWGVVPMEPQARTHNVRRGAGDFLAFEAGESETAEHLVFVVHGIGAICDMRFRELRQCLDDMRHIAQTLSQSHFNNVARRVEFLPVSWHNSFHDEKLDKVLEDISLPSISWVRNFVNHSLMDILFYTSPLYCQTIINEVCSQLNKLHAIFLKRNPSYRGGVSLLGHSLGSVILFDLLAHQVSVETSPTSHSPPLQDQNLPPLEEVLVTLELEEYRAILQGEQIDTLALLLCTEKDLRELGIPMGPAKKLMAYSSQLQASLWKKRILNRSVLSSDSILSTFGEAGTGQSLIQYPKLDFCPEFFFALGSPIAIFLAVRGFIKIDAAYHLPTCVRLLNIFHPFDPVAYRLETLVARAGPPVLVPHHKGRKRFHLELKESLCKMSHGIKAKVLDILSATWNSLNQSKGTLPTAEDEAPWNQPLEDLFHENPARPGAESCGQLNSGKRVDYVLQERPLELLNEYLFALSSHTCYWESEDTVLLVLTQIDSTRPR